MTLSCQAIGRFSLFPESTLTSRTAPRTARRARRRPAAWPCRGRSSAPEVDEDMPCPETSANESTVASMLMCHASRMIDAPSHNRVNRPRNRLPLAISIVEWISPLGTPPSAWRQPWHRRRDVTLRRREAGQAMGPRRSGSPRRSARERSTRHRGEHPVVSVGHVAAGRRLGDLRVVELGGIPVDLGELLARGRRAVAPRGLSRAPAAMRPSPPGGWPTASSRTTGPDRVAGPSRTAMTCQDILEDRGAGADTALELHADFATEPPATTTTWSWTPLR